MANQKMILIADALPQEEGPDMTGCRTSTAREETSGTNDPVLEAIFSALGVDENYLDGNSDRETPAAAHHDPGAGGGEAEPWILHVDDDTDLSQVLGIRLQAHGVRVVQATNGLEGIRRAVNRPPHAIILDHEMPYGDGEYVLKRLRQSAVGKRTPIIMLTGRRDAGLRRRMLNMGADHFLNKPVQITELLDALRPFVPLRQPRRDSRPLHRSQAISLSDSP